MRRLGPAFYGRHTGLKPPPRRTRLKSDARERTLRHALRVISARPAITLAKQSLLGNLAGRLLQQRSQRAQEEAWRNMYGVARTFPLPLAGERWVGEVCSFPRVLTLIRPLRGRLLPQAGEGRALLRLDRHLRAAFGDADHSRAQHAVADAPAALHDLGDRARG
jgi:hypothetical protein